MPQQNKIWEKYFRHRIEPSGECLLWARYRDKTGYGRVSAVFAPGIHFAHRMSWLLAHGPFDLTKRILHTCDTPACVNPEHLWIGSQGDNFRDMVAKGRRRVGRARGEVNWNARLSDDDVRTMRAIRREKHLSYRKIAQQFGVTTMTAFRACERQSWTHI